MKIVLLCGKSTSSAIVYNALSERFDLERVIVEDAVPKKLFIQRRIKKLGLVRVMGQIAFSLGVVPLLKRFAAARRQEILKDNQMDDAPRYMTASHTRAVDSVNSPQCMEYLTEIQPDIVVVNGTRIISKQILECTDAVFINMHAGITPKYRGSHGAYWALCNQDEKNAGVTVHLVDTGIDTGNILYQAAITVTERDNFTTYPLLQTAAGIPLEIQAIQDIMDGCLQTKTNDLPSNLYYNPSVWQYVHNRIKYKVK